MGTTVEEKPLTGIGGWLALMAVGVSLNPLRILAELLIYYGNPETQQAWKLLPGAMAIETCMSLAMLGFSTWVAVLFWRTRRQFPRMFKWMVLAGIVMPILDAMVVSAFGTNVGVPFDRMWAEVWSESGVRDVVRTAFVGGGWTLYLIYSKRVANTFVN